VSRLSSLDAFRGLTMAAMVIVNNPGDWGSVYWPLLHAEWHGWTPTDLVFPFFVFIVGVAIALSRTPSGAWSPIVRRATVLFGLGLFLAGFPRFDVTTWRIPGVLQRIAVCYLAAVAIHRLAGHVARGDARRHARVVALVATGLLLGYWAVMTVVPPPGGQAGDLSAEGNLGAALDRALMGGHLWKERWDPEGALSTIPAIATTLTGILAGFVLRSSASGRTKAARIVAGGLAALVAGLLWDRAFPINKNLWTSSYVVFTSGAAALALVACYWSIDVRGWRAWAWPFVVLGRNAIALFVLSGLVAKTLGLVRVGGATGPALKTYLYRHGFEVFASPKNASLLFAVANLVFLFGVLLLMHRRGLYLKV
jgi:predicted acyltransferase